MKTNYTHLVLLIDRSGSMASIKDDMEGGIKEFIENQKKDTSGDCTITIAEFDDVLTTLHKRVNIDSISDVQIHPRGMTALIDSMCRLIAEVGEDLSSIPEEERPEKVLFITITDGYENSSVEYTKDKLKELIEHQESKYNWNFTYIGANQDAFKVSQEFGGKFGNTLNYEATKIGITTMYSKLSKATVNLRNTSSEMYSCDTFNFSKEE